MPDAAVVFNPTLAAGIRIDAGGASFSTIPTIVEINASSWINQIIALYNRRRTQVFDTPPAAIAYQGGSGLSAAFVASLKTAINDLRAAMGISAAIYTAPATAGKKQTVTFYTELRAALNMTSIGNLAAWSTVAASGIDNNPWGTPASVPFTTSLIGQNDDGFGGTYRVRNGATFPVPSNLINTVVASLKFKTGVVLPGTVSASLFASNTDDGAYATGWQTHLDNAGGVLSLASSTIYNATIPSAAMTARSGANLSLILGETQELANIQDGTFPRFAADFFGPPHWMVELDFGF